MELSQPFRTISYEREVAVSQRVDDLIAENSSLSENLALVRESVAALQIMLDRDNQGWTEIGYLERGNDFPRETLEQAFQLGKNMYLFNPLIKRGILVQQYYVWALGYSITSQNAIIKDFVHKFLNNPRNEVEFGLEGLKEKEAALNYSGNVFLAFFTNRTTGEVRVRSILVNEIRDIYTNPDDAKEPWYYKRALPKENPGDPTRHVWHPDYRYHPVDRPTSLEVAGNRDPINWDVPIYHIKTGGVDGMRWGFPEIFSSIPWARAYKRFLENWSVIMESYAKVSMQMARTDKAKDPGARAKLTAKTPEQRLIGERNGNSDVGQWMLGGVELKAVRTAGQTTSAEEGRPLSLMVAAGIGLPITFFGDVDAGNVATSTTLDRPTELKMRERQGSWKMWLGNVIRYAEIRSAMAPKGVLNAAGFSVLRTVNRVDQTYEYELIPPDGNPYEATLGFPDILERNATERIRALVMGATLMGKKISNVIPDLRYVTRKMLESYGETPEVIEGLMKLWEEQGLFEGKEPEDINPEETPALPFGGGGDSGGS